jgi:hypothetical protein
VIKRFSLLLIAISLLSIASMAQTPSPSVVTSPSPSINQAAVIPSPSPTTEGSGLPNLPWVVEMFASAVMLASVIGVLWVVMRTYKDIGFSIGPRHIQFVSVCLIIPTILILGLEKVLTHETSATLIGGLAGYLLSNIGKYEPQKQGPKKDGSDNRSNDAKGGGQSSDKPKQTGADVVFGDEDDEKATGQTG